VARPPSSDRAAITAVLALLLGLVAVVWLLPDSCARGGSGGAGSPSSNASAAPAIAGAGGTDLGACASLSSRACLGGDAWWLDSCGRRDRIADACHGRGCANGRCLDAPPHGCASLLPPVSEDGRCEGDLLRYCLDGSPQTVDCASLGQRCAVDETGGANCTSKRRCSAAPTGECWGKQLLARCEGEHLRVTRCDHGACEVGADKRARCVRSRVIPAAKVGRCRGCDCPEGPEGDEVCDGYDNNRDGTVDEGVTCPTIDVIAFVLLDDDGRPLETDARVRADVERTNRALSEPGHDTGLQLELREIRRISRPAWLNATGSTIRDAQSDPEVSGAGLPFFLPVVYTRQIKLGQKRVAGMGNFPNNGCADVRFSGAGDASGVLLLAPQRSETTFAHELGHFFGLCHTHMDPFRDQQTNTSVHLPPANDEPLTCPICSRSGDGICDTPPDPGANGGCVLDENTCQVTCPQGETPDAFNLMSYYQPCRRYFTTEQSMHLRRNLWRRLRWRECALDPQKCACTLADDGTAARCDAAAGRMRCQLEPGLAQGRCEPAGSGELGEQCLDDRECDTGLLCAPAPKGTFRVCQHACVVGAGGCECLPVQPPGPAGACLDR
jgi:hypothetical protein